jgi:hypothetical protein
VPVTSLTQDEIADALGNITYRYTATFSLEDPPSSFTVSVDGGPDWEQRLIEAITAEAAKARAVGSLAV